MSEPSPLSLAYLERHRVPMRGTFQMAPGDVFPIEVDNILFGSPLGGRLRLYIPLDVDSAISLRARGQALAHAVLVARELQSAGERADHAAAILNRHSDAVNAVILFYLLRYDVSATYEIDPRRKISVQSLLFDQLDLDDAGANHVFSRLPQPNAFAETFGDKEVAQDEQQALYDEAIFPTVRSYAIILRELTLFVVGGEVIRVGAWLIEWAQDVRIVVAAVQAVLNLAGKYQLVAESLALLSELWTSVAILGKVVMQLLMVIGTHDVLLDVVPALAKLERKLAAFVEESGVIEELGFTPLNGWVVEGDDPVDRALADLVIQSQATL